MSGPLQILKQEHRVIELLPRAHEENSPASWSQE
jgi:hypothetical protein